MTLEHIIKITGKAVPIPGNDIDTDRIMPARFLTEITFDHMGDYLFYDVRFNADGSPTDFNLNKPEFKQAKLMVAGKNFGCGSSREHAPQALKRYGIDAIIGISFAEIFCGNCKEIGIPTVCMDETQLNRLSEHLYNQPDTVVQLDLETCTVTWEDNAVPVSLSEERRSAFLTGYWNSTGLLKSQEAAIRTTASRLPYINGFQSMVG